MSKGYRESGLRLNTWISARDKWTREELEARNDMLMERALEIWSIPQTEYQPAEKQLDSYSLEDDVDLSGRDIIRFSYKNMEQPVGSWIIMMEQLLKIMHDEDKSVLTRLANTHDSVNELSRYVSSNPADLRSALQIDQGIYLERNNSTNTKLDMLRLFFKEYDQNPEDLIFYLRDRNGEGAQDETETKGEDRRRRYWAFALPYIKTEHGTEGSFRNVTTSKQYWISGSFGIRGFSIACEAKLKLAAVVIVLGKSSREENKSAYDFLYARKDEVEAKLGIPLNWWRFDGKSSYVDYHIDGLGIADESGWIQTAKFHAQWSKKFYDVFVPLLQQWNAMR